MNKAPRPFHIAIVGASGAVGRETLSILEERRFPVAQLRLFASKRSAGERIAFGDDELVVEDIEAATLDGIEIAFLAAGGGVSKSLAPKLAAQGTVCIDKSSHFRLDPEVPLVVPGVNDAALAGFRAKNLVATPNCSTIQLVQALKPLHDAAGLRRVICATYQAVSGAGKTGIDELETQVRDLFNSRDLRSTEVFGRRIAFNALPCIPRGGFLPEGATSEERKMIDETRKILGLPDLRVGVTCVRVPVFNAHSEAVHVELANALEAESARELWRKEPHLMVVDDPTRDLYPTPEDASGQDLTLIGRVRTDDAFDHGLAFWVVSDNLRTGAALNAVRIAELLCSEHLS
ncbi:MAG: aspartate-semialdehyde dehydrogenase [Myxococcota bacterium]